MRPQPILVSLLAHSLSVSTLALIIGGVDIWVAIGFSISLISHLYSISTPGQVLQ